MSAAKRKPRKPARPTSSRSRTTTPAQSSTEQPRWKERLGQYWLLVRGNKPVGWLLLLWPTWWGLWLAADGFPPPGILVIFTLGVWLTRSAGCVVNDYADRWLDGSVERTKERPLARGSVSGREALMVFAVLMLVAFGLVLLTNRLTIYLSLIAVVLASSYPYLKRYTYLPQVYLGIAFGWSIPMAFAAIQNTVPPIAWLLFCANVLWSTAYDTWYAMVDRDDDIRMGAKSTAILFGDLDLIVLGVLQGGFLLALIMVGQRAELGVVYCAGLGIAAGLIAWEFWIGRRRDREGCFRAFLHNSWVGAVVFAGLAVDTMMR